MGTVETLVGWFWAICIMAVVVGFLSGLVVIAFSPLLAGLYFIADWYERKKRKKSSSDTQPTSQGETEASLGESPKTHGN